MQRFAIVLAVTLAAMLVSPDCARAEETDDPAHSPIEAAADGHPAATAPPKDGHQHGEHRGPPGTAAPRASTAALTQGRQVFAQNCAGCHGAAAEGKVGPKLAGTSHSAIEIRQFVTRGFPPKMPSFQGKLTPPQIAAVAAYVKSLGPARPGAGHEHGKPGAMEGHQHGEPGAMGDESRVAGQEMSRAGSGTSWLPESSPMWAKHAMFGKWTLMHHGDLKVMYDAQGGPRGVSRPVSSNWYMAMGSRPLGKGELMLRLMMSLEAATFGNNGQPQLFQTGEGLLDRQHPHDLFMEIGTQYIHPLGEKLGAYLYLAPVGEPALGPVAFMHRPSAAEIPTAPLVHHWTDSTHISYGVITAGVQSRHWKLEGSWFNGHEPDSRRWAFDSLALNSHSGRLSYAPNPNWVFQVSHGRLDNPEFNNPDDQHGSVRRTTFSASHNRPLGRGNWATTFVWGRNGEVDGSSNGFLLESSYNWAERNYLFGRVERVDKDELFAHPDHRADRKFMVNAFSLGYARDIGRSRCFETAIGAMATVYAKSSSLDRAYGDFPVGVQVFLRIRPRRMAMQHGAAMDHQNQQQHKEHQGHPGHGAGRVAPRSSRLLSALLSRWEQ